MKNDFLYLVQTCALARVNNGTMTAYEALKITGLAILVIEDCLYLSLAPLPARVDVFFAHYLEGGKRPEWLKIAGEETK